MTKAQRKTHLGNVAARIEAKAQRYEDLSRTAATAKQRRRWAHLARSRRRRAATLTTIRNSV